MFRQLTFAASANAIRYVGAIPEFVDCTADSWNMDPDVLEEELGARAARNDLPKAVIAVDLYGQPADYKRLTAICRAHGVPLIADSAESLGAEYDGAPAGSFGDIAIFSFNGNKIITTSGGGALVSDNKAWVDEARSLASQARDPALHYEHSKLGYNYRLSNLLAALGVAQLKGLAGKVDRRRAINQRYRSELASCSALEFMPEAPHCRSTFWLTALTIAPDADVKPIDLITALGEENIEARPVWKPMHLQPYYSDCHFVGSGVSDVLFHNGLCLPSGSNMTEDDQTRVIETLKSVLS